MNKCTERLYNGIIKENPTFVQMLGMCPTLAVTTTAMNGLGMGLATTAVLSMSNLMISALRKLIPDKVRIPAFITIIASFVTVIGFLMEAYTPELYDSLGVYIALIVVNCIILGRAESYASKNPPLPSLFDGLGMGLGFTLGLTVIGIIREFLGAGSIFGIAVTKKLFDPIAIFSFNPGAFFVLAFIIAGINAYELHKEKKTGKKAKLRKIEACADCTNVSCSGKKETFEVTLEAEEETKKNLLKEAEAKKKEADAKVKETEAKTKEAEAKVKEAEAKTKDAEAKVKEAEAKTKDAEAKVKEAKAKEEKLEKLEETAELDMDDDEETEVLYQDEKEDK